MALTSPRRTGLTEQVIAQLRNQITSGEWPMGTRIPTEPELVEQLGVARNTLREAVRALANNGLLDIRQGSGTYVAATSELTGVMRRRFAGASIQDFAELRSALESQGAKMAAERRSEREMKLLAVALQRREAAWESGNLQKFIDADSTLHLAIVAASHNEVLTGLYADLNGAMRDFLRANIGGELKPESHVDHARLLEAIRVQDAPTAAAEAASHALQCLWEPASGG